MRAIILDLSHYSCVHVFRSWMNLNFKFFNMKFFNMNLRINHPQQRFTIGFARDRDDLIRLFFGYGKMDPAAGPRVGRSNFRTRHLGRISVGWALWVTQLFLEKWKVMPFRKSRVLEGEFPQLNLPKLLDLSQLNYDTEHQPASQPHWVCSNTGFVFETTINLWADTGSQHFIILMVATWFSSACPYPYDWPSEPCWFHLPMESECDCALTALYMFHSKKWATTNFQWTSKGMGISSIFMMNSCI